MTNKHSACDPKKIESCRVELRSALTTLAGEHTSSMVIAALVEHVGGGLAISQRARACTPRTVRAILARLRRIALST